MGANNKKKKFMKVPKTTHLKSLLPISTSLVTSVLNQSGSKSRTNKDNKGFGEESASNFVSLNLDHR